MSYEVRDGYMVKLAHGTEVVGGATGQSYVVDRKPVGKAVSDALDVLRAAGWKVERTGSKRYVHGTPGGYKQTIESFVVRSPWREVEQ